MSRAFAIAVFAFAILPGIVRADERVGMATTLRDTGYLLGDLLDERVEIRLPAGAEIDAGSLPLPGRVAPWLEVRRISLTPRDAAGLQTLIVTYQIFAETEAAARVPIPEFPLRLRGGTAPVVTVPAESFLLSPALPSPLTDADRELVPPAEPRPISSRGAVAGALVSLSVAAAAAFFLLWRYDRLPFLPFAPGPLAAFWRRWRQRALADDDATRLLREWHASLNRCAGETLYPSTLGRIAKPVLRRAVATVFSGAARTLGKRASQYPRGKQAV